MLYQWWHKSWRLMAGALILALVAGLVLVPSPAAAQGKDPGQVPAGLPAKLARLRPVLGQVTQLGTDQFTLTTRNGVERTFRYDDQTRFIDSARQPLSAADLAQDGWVAVVSAPQGRVGGLLNRLLRRGQAAPAAGQAAGQSVLARIVVILPGDFDPDQAQGARGLVTGVDPAAHQFTLVNRQGVKSTLTVDDQTKFTGQAAALSDLEAGMGALVLAEKQPDGSLLAQQVRAGFAPQRRAGEVVAVDPAAGQFTLKTRKDGQELTIHVDSNTRFRSRGKSVQSLADLKAGMPVLVVANEASGVYTARAVAVLKGTGQ